MLPAERCLRAVLLERVLRGRGILLGGRDSLSAGSMPPGTRSLLFLLWELHDHDVPGVRPESGGLHLDGRGLPMQSATPVPRAARLPAACPTAAARSSGAARTAPRLGARGSRVRPSVTPILASSPMCRMKMAGMIEIVRPPGEGSARRIVEHRGIGPRTNGPGAGAGQTTPAPTAKPQTNAYAAVRPSPARYGGLSGA